eukprot:m.187906 g.187906  ORF g.187906 m.187906 type:complete len:76 (+) comp15614_c0_seq26:2264-2491(+)
MLDDCLYVLDDTSNETYVIPLSADEKEIDNNYIIPQPAQAVYEMEDYIVPQAPEAMLYQSTQTKDVYQPIGESST